MKRSLGITTLLSFAIAAGCGGSGDETQTSSGPIIRPIQMGEKSQVVDKNLADKIEADPAHPEFLVFPKDGFDWVLAKKAGDILIGDKGSKTGTNRYGFLRKVKSVEDQGTKIYVATENATLPEAVKDGAFRADLQIPALGPTGQLESVNAAPGLQPQGKMSLLKFDGYELFDANPSIDVGGKQVGFHTWAKLSKGSLDFTPKFDVGADIGWFELKEFHAIAKGTLDAVIEVDAGLQLASTLDGDTLALLIAQSITNKPSKTIYEYPIDLGTLSIGPLPLPSSADFKLDLNCEFIWRGGAEVKVGAVGQAVITAGIKYKDGTVEGVFDKSVTMNPTGPDWTLDGTVKLRCSLQPSFELKLFGIASGKVWGDAYGELDANVECGSGHLTGKVNGEAFCGARAGVEAKVDVFGLYKWKYGCTLFDWESQHAQASGTFTLPGGQGGTCSPDTSEVQKPAPADPKMCFGNEGQGGSGGGGTGGSGNGGSGGSTGGSAGADGGLDGGDGGEAGPCTKDLVAPDVWTCEAKKYGDCVCDCNCGAPDDDCKTGECNACSHDVCTTGDPLSPNCDACTAQVCAQDSYCCATLWSGSCVMEAQQLCGMCN